jgi:hypothetical protein
MEIVEAASQNVAAAAINRGWVAFWVHELFLLFFG